MSNNLKNENQFYWQYFGLLRNPFARENEPSMLFLPDFWEQHLDLFQHWLTTQNSIVAVFGPKGRGKTTFINLVYANLDDVCHVYLFQANSKITLTSLIDFLVQKYDLSEPTGEIVEENLEHLINDLQYKDKTSVLLIDEAHLLSEDIINALFFMIKQQNRHQMRFHVMLFGQPELQKKLLHVKQETLDEELLLSLELEPFSIEETERYIRHRLVKAGLKEPFPLTKDSILRIYEMSQGNPEDINQKTETFLIDEIDRQRTVLSPSFLQRYQTHMIGAGVLFFLFIFALGLLLKEPQHEDAKKAQIKNNALAHTSYAEQTIQFNENSNRQMDGVSSGAAGNLSSQQNQSFSNPQQSQQQLNQSQTTSSYNNNSAMPSPVTTNTTQPNNNHFTNTPGFVPANGQTTQAPQVSNQPFTDPANSQKNAVSSQNQGVNNTNTNINMASQPAKENNVNAPVNTSSFNAQPNTEANNNMPQQPTNVTATASSSPMNSEPKQVVSANVPDTAQVQQDVQNYKEEAKLTTKKANENIHNNDKEHHDVKKSKIVAHKKTKDSLARTDLATNRFTLQLAALNDEKSVKKMINENHLQGRAHFLLHKVNGKSYYVLIYGSYPSKEAAKSAILSLPKSFQSAAWPRKMATYNEKEQG